MIFEELYVVLGRLLNLLISVQSQSSTDICIRVEMFHTVLLDIVALERLEGFSKDTTSKCLNVFQILDFLKPGESNKNRKVCVLCGSNF